MTTRSPLRSLAPATVVLLAGCGGAIEDAGMRAYVDRHLDAWTGVRSEQVLQRFGAPDDDVVLLGGDRVLRYRRRQPVLRVLDCAIDFRIGAMGRVRAARCSGPAEQCRMLLNPATRYAPSTPAPVVGFHVFR